MDAISVRAVPGWISSALIYLSVSSIFYCINIFILLFTLFSKNIKHKKDVFQVILISVSMNLFSNFTYVFFSYVWIYSYKSGSSIHINFSNAVAQSRFIGMNLIFITPLVLSIWRYMILVLKFNIKLYHAMIIVAICLVPNIIAFIDSNFWATDIKSNDIFTYEKPYTHPFLSFLFFIPQILCPILSVVFSMLILRNYSKKFALSGTDSKLNKQQRLLTYSLLVNSVMPVVGALPNFIFFTSFTYGIAIPRFFWNLSEFMILVVGGMTPSCMVFFIPSFTKPLTKIFGCKMGAIAVSMTMIQTGSRNGKTAIPFQANVV